MIEFKIQVHMGYHLSSVFFKDSYKFMNLPLRLLPKSFGFHNELHKGNMHYISDSLPDVGYFKIDQMNEEEKMRF